MNTITANMPARSTKTPQGKIINTPARNDIYTCDADGRWSYASGIFEGEKILEEDVIDACKRATNWQDIRRTHFPMYGFHS